MKVWVASILMCLTGCGSLKPATSTPLASSLSIADGSHLIGSWSLACGLNFSTQMMTQRTVTFDGTYMTVTDTSYLEPTSCVTPYSKQVYKRQYTATVDSTNNLYLDLDTTLMTVTVQPLSATATDDYNNTDTCGKSWTLNIAIDVTGTPCAPENLSDYDLAAFSGNDLFFGDRLSGSGTDASTRPSRVDQTVIYVLQ